MTPETRQGCSHAYVLGPEILASYAGLTVPAEAFARFPPAPFRLPLTDCGHEHCPAQLGYIYDAAVMSFSDGLLQSDVLYLAVYWPHTSSVNAERLRFQFIYDAQQRVIGGAVKSH